MDWMVDTEALHRSMELDGRGDYDLHRFRNKQKETLWKVKTWTRLQDVARFTHELACRRA